MPFILRGKDRYARPVRRFVKALPLSAREWALARVVISNEAKWEMIGAAYVHGIMDGEMVDEVLRKERFMQMFEIW